MLRVKDSCSNERGNDRCIWQQFNDWLEDICRVDRGWIPGPVGIFVGYSQENFLEEDKEEEIWRVSPIIPEKQGCRDIEENVSKWKRQSKRKRNTVFVCQNKRDADVGIDGVKTIFWLSLPDLSCKSADREIFTWFTADKESRFFDFDTQLSNPLTSFDRCICDFFIG